MRHYRAKPIEVREGLFRIAVEASGASCRMVADRFNRYYLEQGLSVGKTYVAEFLRVQTMASSAEATYAFDR